MPDKFPYKRQFYSDEQIHEMFDKLKKYSYKKRLLIGRPYSIHTIAFPASDLKFINKPVILVNKPSDYTDFNILSDMFQEECRMQCTVYGQKHSPHEYYTKHANEVAKSAKSKRPYDIREAVYKSVKECTSFRPTNIMAIIQMFGSKCVLDPSSGWGDRLLGAMAADVDYYVGVDPNKCLHPNYEKMIRFFGKSPEHFIMIESPIESAKLPKLPYDLVFTSPPYFDLEKYSNAATQSISKYKSENLWFEKFLKVQIKKSWNILTETGHFVMVISQKHRGEKYIRGMMDYIYTFPDSYYLGVIAYADENISSPQPMWIWKKSVGVPKALYNPKVIIKNVTYDKKIFHVIRDDFLIGGTKQRALVELIEATPGDEFVYAGPVYGYAQIALAYAAYLTRKKATIFVEKRDHMHPFTKRASAFGDFVKIVQVPQPTFLKDIQQKASEYAEKAGKGTVLLPFGLSSDAFTKMLVKNIREAFPENREPKRMWLVAGSATLLNALYKIFPKTLFFVVQVGKKIYPDQLKPNRTALYISDEKFVDSAKMQPPYPSVKNYDAKVWKYVVRYGKSGDYIWNVGRDI